MTNPSKMKASQDNRLDRLRHRMRHAWVRWLSDTRGVAAIEFALLIPVMLVMYIGTVEITQAVHVDRKLALVNRVVGDLIGRDAMDDQPMSAFQAKISAGLDAMAPVNMSGLSMRVTSYAVDAGGPSNAARAFVDWQMVCTVAAYTGYATPNATCAIGGNTGGFSGGMKRCEIDTAITVDTMKSGTPLLRLEVNYTHKPLLAGMFGSNDQQGWFTFISPSGFQLGKLYYTWPRSNSRTEGPTGAPMQTKGGASNDPNKDPAATDVCGGLPGTDAFKT